MQRVMAMRLRLLQRPVRIVAQSNAAFSTKAPEFSDIVYGQDTGRLHKIEANKTVNAVVFSGNGGKAFCAGATSARWPTMEKIRQRATSRSTFSVTKAIISFLNGVTMGGGVGLSMHGKFVVATEKTLFAMPETAIGFFPDVGASHLLPRLGRRLIEGEDYVADVPKSQALKDRLGTYLALTGERLKGHEVIGLGLATTTCPQRVRDAGARDEMIHEALEELETDEAFQEIDPVLETVESVFGALNDNDTMEGIFERLEKLNTEWSQETLATLKKMSPLSLKVTLEQMRQGAVKTCAECFQMEYRMATRMMENPDFFEGVRSVVVDKDRNPKWSKRDITKVTAKEVEAFFKPLDKDQELILYPSATAVTEKEE
ncbi:Enoyl-CoA hydratase/isomerase, HIBYL-CoA-H type [Phytophthora cactorum]|nr:Enoyl-CoA hydratase/isomerase, HIBYL-CoA-H type [Phytophthora cactorum]